MNKKPKLYLMVGISASGKSTIAKQIAKENECTIISSDSIRKEICGNINDQYKNEEVFKICRQRIKENLLNGNSVVADVTNISRKSRKHILDHILEIDCVKIAYIIPKRYEQCLDDNIYRENSVLEHVITRQMMGFQIPFYEEGFDEIILHDFGYQVNNNYLEDIKNKMNNFNQMNPHHNATIGEHCRIATEEFAKRTKNISLIFGSSFHDFGKMCTIKIDSSGIAHYYGHENVGTYKLLTNRENFNFMTDSEFLDMLFLVNYHMMPMSWESEKTNRKWEKIFGVKKFEMLKYFNKCDKIRLTD